MQIWKVCVCEETDEIHSETRKRGVKLKERALIRKWKSCGRDLGDLEAT